MGSVDPGEAPRNPMGSLDPGRASSRTQVILGAVLFPALLLTEFVLVGTPAGIRRVKEVPPDALWVEPDRLRFPQSEIAVPPPDDPLYAMQTALQAIHAPEAWS